VCVCVCVCVCVFLFFECDYDYLQFYVPLKNFSLHHCRWGAAKIRPTCMLGAQGLWAGTGLYRATPGVTRYLGFSGLIRRTAPFSRLLRHTRGCGGYILTRILTGVFECVFVCFFFECFFFFECVFVCLFVLNNIIILTFYCMHMSCTNLESKCTY
jgi:hypothetical protein